MSSGAIPEVFTDITVDPFVRGRLHRPAKSNGDALLLTHGAGGNCNAPLLVALAETFADAGFTVLRCDLPYRQDRPYGPPGPGDPKRDRAGLKNAANALKNLVRGREGGPPNAVSVGWEEKIFLGGQSYGGRQASMLAAEEPDLASGLLLLSYPLHPPRKAEQMRTQHFFNLKTPALFVSGTRDPFGSIEELQQAIKLIPAKTNLITVEGAGHDLGFKGKTKISSLPGTVAAEFQSFFAA
jgi:uncharacterized protein